MPCGRRVFGTLAMTGSVISRADGTGTDPQPISAEPCALDSHGLTSPKLGPVRFEQAVVDCDAAPAHNPREPASPYRSAARLG
jgi:hypothetical protein